MILVKWNEPYQKLASCDSSGIIFVWIKYEGRWSIELINDRNTAVTHFSWSHDGRMALICYRDGFVLVGSVAGQRYWSSMLNLEATITCGIWTPDDQQVKFCLFYLFFDETSWDFLTSYLKSPKISYGSKVESLKAPHRQTISLARFTPSTPIHSVDLS